MHIFSHNVGHLEWCRRQVEFLIKFPCTGTWWCTAGSHNSVVLPLKMQMGILVSEWGGVQ